MCVQMFLKWCFLFCFVFCVIPDLLQDKFSKQDLLFECDFPLFSMDADVKL